MLTPEQIGSIPENIVQLYSQLESFIISDFARRVQKTGRITETAQWIKERASMYGINNIEKEAVRILNISLDEVDSIFPEIADISVSQENDIYIKAKLDTVTIKGNEELESYILAAIKQTKGELKNITRSLGFAVNENGKLKYKPIAKFYQDTLNFTHMKISTGVQDYNTAIKQAVKTMTDSGLRYVDYESGWTNRIDVATRRAVLTGTHQMNQQLTNANMDRLISKDEQFAETTAHAGARPSHQVWQGRVFKVNGSTSEYGNLVEATKLGDVTGLEGANCRHSYHVFIPGVSIRTYTDKELKNIDPTPFGYKGRTFTAYQASQYQRKIETAIRDTKRQLIAYREAGLDEDFKNASILLQRQKQEYREFSKVSGLREKKERIQVYGYDKRISQKAVWANKKANE